MPRTPKGKKARKAAPVKARIKKRSMARLQAIAPDTGPVTLEEARALAAGKTADAGVPRRWQNRSAASVARGRGRRAPEAEKGTARRARAAAFANTRPRWRS